MKSSNSIIRANALLEIYPARIIELMYSCWQDGISVGNTVLECEMIGLYAFHLDVLVLFVHWDEISVSKAA